MINLFLLLFLVIEMTWSGNMLKQKFFHWNQLIQTGGHPLIMVVCHNVQKDYIWQVTSIRDLQISQLISNPRVNLVCLLPILHGSKKLVCRIWDLGKYDLKCEPSNSMPKWFTVTNACQIQVCCNITLCLKKTALFKKTIFIQWNTQVTAIRIQKVSFLMDITLLILFFTVEMSKANPDFDSLFWQNWQRYS